MGYKTNFLSQTEVCAIYQCLEGHIHFKYRTVDIAMDADDFYQVAEVFTKALHVLRKAEDPEADEVTLETLDVQVKI